MLDETDVKIETFSYWIQLYLYDKNKEAGFVVSAIRMHKFYQNQFLTR